MAAFVRKNAITISATFTAANGDDNLQPSAAYVELVFQDLSGSTQRVSLTMSESSGVWSATWDSSAAGPGTVQWVAYGTGTLEAAQQGQFEILANAANTV